jgi:hypothetical protein
MKSSVVRSPLCVLRFVGVVVCALALCVTASAQKKKREDQKAGYERAARATVLHTANVYAMADAATPPITTVTPGHEVVVNQRNGPWVSVFANTDAKDDEDDETTPEFADPTENPDPSSGWIRDKGLVGPTTPGGDALIFGYAAQLEAEAAEPHAPKGAAASAHLLYRRVAEYFPDSPLAAEAAYRSADIRWQIDKADSADLPSAKEMDAGLRPRLYDGELKRVMRYFPQTPQAAKAAYDLLDAKLCGDWQGLAKCPEMETGLYMKYAQQYPGGPKSAEALYQAAYRQGALVTLYQVDDNGKRSEEAARNCQAIADQMKAKYPESDWTARAESIAFRVAQGIPIYGNDRS